MNQITADAVTCMKDWTLENDIQEELSPERFSGENWREVLTHDILQLVWMHLANCNVSNPLYVLS